MNFTTRLLSIGATLALGAALPAAAAPYIVYSGSISQASTLRSSEATAVQNKINAKLAAFHKLNPTLQNDIKNYLSKAGGSSTDTLYVILDEQNVGYYTAVLLDPTGTGGKVMSVNEGTGSAPDPAQNFISGFDFPTTGGLGVFRFAISRATGNDPATSQPASYVLQGYGTGAMITTANAQIAPRQPAETFFLVTNGVKGGQQTVPSFPAILSATGATYVSSFSGNAFGYYFDDASSQSIGGATTKGTFTLSINVPLTQLANNGGKYAPNLKNVANVPPIAASNTDAFKTWAKILLDVN